jgi:hypothetical protein
MSEYDRSANRIIWKRYEFTNHGKIVLWFPDIKRQPGQMNIIYYYMNRWTASTCHGQINDRLWPILVYHDYGAQPVLLIHFLR